jgi:hypothetical protein
MQAPLPGRPKETTVFTKAVVAACFVLATTNAFAAQGKGKIHWMTTLPPAQYDVPYTGELTIWTVQSRSDILQYCSKEKILEVQASWSGNACTHVNQNKKWGCHIYMLSDKAVKAEGRNPTIILRHELGHCNGWGRDHAGGRKVFVDDYSVKAPELPKATKTIRAYPPLVCLTPDGSEESCADRSVKPNVGALAQAEGPPTKPADPWAKSVTKREGYRFAPSGKLMTFDVLYGVKIDCTPYMPIDVQLSTPPNHGMVEFPVEAYVMTGWTDPNPRVKCNGNKAEAIYINYTSNDGYKGPETFTVFTIWPNGTASEWKYTIDVR